MLVQGKQIRKGGYKYEVMPSFVLSEILPLILGKLAHCIQKRKYVDMAELLKDNVEA